VTVPADGLFSVLTAGEAGILRALILLISPCRPPLFSSEHLLTHAFMSVCILMLRGRSKTGGGLQWIARRSAIFT
jgi:hypothetical protein